MTTLAIKENICAHKAVVLVCRNGDRSIEITRVRVQETDIYQVEYQSEVIRVAALGLAQTIGQFLVQSSGKLPIDYVVSELTQAFYALPNHELYQHDAISMEAKPVATESAAQQISYSESLSLQDTSIDAMFLDEAELAVDRLPRMPSTVVDVTVNGMTAYAGENLPEEDQYLEFLSESHLLYTDGNGDRRIGDRMHSMVVMESEEVSLKACEYIIHSIHKDMIIDQRHVAVRSHVSANGVWYSVTIDKSTVKQVAALGLANEIYQYVISGHTDKISQYALNKIVRKFYANPRHEEMTHEWYLIHNDLFNDMSK